MKKVSVVVPAYCPGDGINRVVRSLDAQTMSTDDFELIIIDDGSPDGTWKRLEEIRDERSYVRIDRIPNSGWPSRPRNVGTDLAEGEYVLYMDHDDELFPDGLQVAYDFASRNRADVLNAKESKTSDISWGISNYSADIPNAKPSRGIDALLPMMPHKFYRTAFLRDHNIRFPEGHRMLWEDIYFNVAAFRHADVISILSSTPVYLWVQTKSNSSATYRPRDEEFWQKLTALLTYIHQTLPGDEFAAARDATLAHQLNTRVIGRFYTEYGKSKDRRWLPMAQGYLTNILENLMPARLDERLPVVVKPRAFLIRHGRFDLLDALRKSEGSWVGKSQADDIHWDSSGQLVVTSTARWTNAKGQPLTLLRSGDTLLRSLPAELMQVLPAQLVDVTKAVQNGRTMVTVRDRQARVTWTAPSDRQTSLVPVAGAAAAGSSGDADAVTVAISST
ncbi:MAG: glycosyltransferase family 2 protein, partial [Propionibacteriaceae bacterium]